MAGFLIPSFRRLAGELAGEVAREVAGRWPGGPRAVSRGASRAGDLLPCALRGGGASFDEMDCFWARRRSAPTKRATAGPPAHGSSQVDAARG